MSTTNCTWSILEYFVRMYLQGCELQQITTNIFFFLTHFEDKHRDRDRELVEIVCLHNCSQLAVFPNNSRKVLPIKLYKATSQLTFFSQHILKTNIEIEIENSSRSFVYIIKVNWQFFPITPAMYSL